MEKLSLIKLNLSEKLADKSYRASFFKEWAQDNVAMNMRLLRDKRGLLQKQLAELCGTGQSAISRIEQAEYSAWNFTTLLHVAEALDARIRVTFEPAEDVIKQYKMMEAQSNASILGTGALIGTGYGTPERPEISVTSFANNPLAMGVAFQQQTPNLRKQIN